MRSQSYTVGPWTIVLDAEAYTWRVTIAHADDPEGSCPAGVAYGTEPDAGGAMAAYLSAVSTARLLHAHHRAIDPATLPRPERE